MSKHDKMLADVLLVHGGRLVGDGLPFTDVTEAENTLSTWDQWFPFWEERAGHYERLAERELSIGRRLSAGNLYWYASMAYHYAQFLWFHDIPRREAGQRQKQRLYCRAAPLFQPSAERFEAQHESFQIPGFLRIPPGDGPFPCVVLLGGLESTKEESYHFENLCLARGLATCTFDGPGQGEFFFQSPLRPDFECFTSAVVDYLAQRPEIDMERLGILGRSLGGYYAVRSAALDHRFKACVAWGALFDLSYYDSMHGSARDGFAYVAGFSSPDDASAYLKRSIDLSEVAGALRCPLFVLHGKNDHLIPVQQVERLQSGASSSAKRTIDIPEDGNHCCHNISHVVRPRMADWLAEQLGGNT